MNTTCKVTFPDKEEYIITRYSDKETKQVTPTYPVPLPRIEEWVRIKNPKIGDFMLDVEQYILARDILFHERDFKSFEPTSEHVRIGLTELNHAGIYAVRPSNIRVLPLTEISPQHMKEFGFRELYSNALGCAVYYSPDKRRAIF